jgi:hypothetical protein
MLRNFYKKSQGQIRVSPKAMGWCSASISFADRIDSRFLPLDPAGGYAPDVRAIEALAPVR